MNNVLCPNGHVGRFTNHGPNVGQGWYCPECREDIAHVDNVYGSAAKIAARSDTTIAYPRVGDMINCLKTPCRACRGVYRKLPPLQISIGDTITCVNARGIDELEMNKAYEVVAVEGIGLRIRILKKGAWENRAYSRCRFKWGGKL